jgi:hypothetical protein
VERRRGRDPKSVASPAARPDVGPILTDQLFKNPAQVGYSMAIVAAIVGPLGCIAFLAGLRPFAKAVSEQG